MTSPVGIDQTINAAPRDRPILFSSPMVRALLAGQKTQTRRIVKHQPPLGYNRVEILNLAKGIGARFENDDPPLGMHTTACPFGHPGDQLWVKETWRTYSALDNCKPSQIRPGAGVQYEAGGSNVLHHEHRALHGMGRIRQSIFMPRWASRITLEVTSVRVERLQDISEEDARAEGVCGIDLPGALDDVPLDMPRDRFAVLWSKINGTDSWETNPWLWVVAFKVVK